MVLVQWVREWVTRARLQMFFLSQAHATGYYRSLCACILKLLMRFKKHALMYKCKLHTLWAGFRTPPSWGVGSPSGKVFIFMNTLLVWLISCDKKLLPTEVLLLDTSYSYRPFRHLAGAIRGAKLLASRTRRWRLLGLVLAGRPSSRPRHRRRHA